MTRLLSKHDYFIESHPAIMINSIRNRKIVEVGVI